MSVTNLARPVGVETITYPESDGKPMADNSVQFRYISTIVGNLEILFENNPEVLVVGDMFWYPLEGNNQIRVAPDVMVVFGCPKGDRGAYLQWQEGGIAPQVVFEILSPGNSKGEMTKKFNFYEGYGVEEYYIYDPARGDLRGWRRDGAKLRVVEEITGWVSPRLGVHFDLEGNDLVLYYPDGSRFLTFVELNQKRREAEARAKVEAEARTAAEARIRELEAKLKQAGLL